MTNIKKYKHCIN